jgi:hypothetical protein
MLFLHLNYFFHYKYLATNKELRKSFRSNDKILHFVLKKLSGELFCFRVNQLFIIEFVSVDTQIFFSRWHKSTNGFKIQQIFFLEEKKVEN